MLQGDLTPIFAHSSPFDHMKESTTEMIRVRRESTQGGRSVRTHAPCGAAQAGSHALHDSLLLRVLSSQLELDMPLTLVLMTPLHLGTLKLVIGSLYVSLRQHAALVGILGAQALPESVENLVASWASRRGVPRSGLMQRLSCATRIAHSKGL